MILTKAALRAYAFTFLAHCAAFGITVLFNPEIAEGWIVITIIMLALISWLNVIFLLIIYAMKMKEYLLKLKYLLLEIILLLGITLLVDKLIELIPYEYIFEVTPKLTSRRVYFGNDMQTLYVHVILLLVLVLFRKYVIRPDIEHKTDYKVLDH